MGTGVEVDADVEVGVEVEVEVDAEVSGAVEAATGSDDDAGGAGDEAAVTVADDRLVSSGAAFSTPSLPLFGLSSFSAGAVAVVEVDFGVGSAARGSASELTLVRTGVVASEGADAWALPVVNPVEATDSVAVEGTDAVVVSVAVVVVATDVVVVAAAAVDVVVVDSGCGVAGDGDAAGGHGESRTMRRVPCATKPSTERTRAGRKRSTSAW